MAFYGFLAQYFEIEMAACVCDDVDDEREGEDMRCEDYWLAPIIFDHYPRLVFHSESTERTPETKLLAGKATACSSGTEIVLAGHQKHQCL